MNKCPVFVLMGYAILYRWPWSAYTLYVQMSMNWSIVALITCFQQCLVFFQILYCFVLFDFLVLFLWGFYLMCFFFVEDGIEEMADTMNCAKIQYCFLRVIDPNSNLPKNVLINWVSSRPISQNEVTELCWNTFLFNLKRRLSSRNIRNVGNMHWVFKTTDEWSLLINFCRKCIVHVHLRAVN